MLEIVRIILIIRYYNNLLASYISIKIPKKLIDEKQYYLIFKANVTSSIKGYNICLPSKLMRYKFYYNLQSFLILIHQWKNLSIDFVIKLLISFNWKREIYDLILVFVNLLTKIVYYKPFKVIINALGLAKIIIKIVL